ncbi:flagellar basal body rod protein FlgG [Pseudobacillus sp. FSL P4-0506]|uniref:flagellar basal body rod protein FlgG n=1 Tax=unclassified Pseudobacillus TaxID=2619284 RepID=UPI0030FBB8E5
MLRSMYAGISGMKNFQTKLDVIGNNIANVNTFGFKKGRTTFKDMVNQQIAGASAPGASIGGANPKQIGLGSQLSTIDTIHTQGSLQTTGRVLDLAISGDGFFMTGNKDSSGKIVNQRYTRNGNFYLDKNGEVVNSEGDFLVKAIPDPNDPFKAILFIPITIPPTAKSFGIGSDGLISYVDSSGNIFKEGWVPLAKFTNPDGLQKSGSNSFVETANSGEPIYNYAGQGGAGTIVPGTLEMSNVDLSEEFTEMIVAQRGFQANTRIITTSDEILQELVNLKR